MFHHGVHVMISRYKMSHHGSKIISTVADPGEGPGGARPSPPPIFLDQTEALQKNFFGEELFLSNFVPLT